MKTVEEMRADVIGYCDQLCPTMDDRAYVYNSMEKRHWIAAYRLLGLESRDAVEAERAFWKDLEDERKASDLELAKIYAESEVGRLQEIVKAAKLVEAVDGARAAIEYDDDISTALILIKKALAAHKEGGDNV